MVGSRVCYWDEDGVSRYGRATEIYSGPPHKIGMNGRVLVEWEHGGSSWEWPTELEIVTEEAAETPQTGVEEAVAHLRDKGWEIDRPKLESGVMGVYRTWRTLKPGNRTRTRESEPYLALCAKAAGHLPSVPEEPRA